MLLSDNRAEAETYVNRTIESRKEQHRRWNQNWQDRTWNPITPPPEPADEPAKWAPLFAPATGYPTPPPSHKSGSPVDGDGDVKMEDANASHQTPDELPSREPQVHLIKAFSAAPSTSSDSYFGDSGSLAEHTKQSSNPPLCRIRYGRGGRRFLEVRRPRTRALVRGGVVSDSDSDDEMVDFNPVPDYKIFEYRVMMNRGSNAARPEGVVAASADRRQAPGGDQTAAATAGQATAGAANPHTQATPQQTATASGGS